MWQAAWTKTSTQHVERIVLVGLGFLRIPRDERSRCLDPQVSRSVQDWLYEVEIQMFLTDVLHPHGSGLDAEVQTDAPGPPPSSSVRPRPRSRPAQTRASDIRDPVTASQNSITLRRLTVNMSWSNLKSRHAVSRVQEVELPYQAVGRFESETSLKESGGGAEGAREGASPAGLIRRAPNPRAMTG